MERYTKTYKSKWQSQYSEEFKRKICQEYLEGNKSLNFLEKQYKLGNSRISSWLRSFGLGVKKPIYLSSALMPSKKESEFESTDNATVRSLKKQLEDALLEKELYRKMIEVAERDLKISIQKKSATK